MEKCLPLELVKWIGEKGPGIYDKLEEIRVEENRNGESWNKKCYVPMTRVYKELLKSGFDFYKCVYYSSVMVGLSAWRIHKQMYKFDEDLEKMLLNQKEEDLILPVEVINNLPFSCIYIETKSIYGADGVFAYFEDYNGQMELRFLLVGYDKENIEESDIIPALINLTPGKTIKELIDSLVEEECNLAKVELGEVTQESVMVHDIISSALQLVLYICAQNSEIDEDPEQKKIARKPKDFAFIKDKYREVQKWNCGTTTGEMIREYRRNQTQYEYDPDPGKTGKAKRPHSRRGHWHSYWLGKRGTPERRIVLKWLAPMFIHKMMENGVTTNIVRDKNLLKEEKNESTTPTCRSGNL